MGNVSSGIGPYHSFYGGRFGITNDDELVVGGQIYGTPYKYGAGVPYYCDPANGDNNLSGRTPGTAVASLVTAEDLTTASQNDAVILLGDGSATPGTARLTANLDWDKDATHLIGVGAPNWQAKRTRISHAASAPATNFILMTFSGDGCIFENIGMFCGMAESADETAFAITGNRNYFGRMAFEGLGHATPAARAGSEVGLLTGARENMFESCVFGLETQARSSASATLRFQTECRRNTFRDSLFPMYATANTPLYIDILTGGEAGSSEYFFNCAFLEIGLSGSTEPAVVAAVHSAANGTVYFDANCTTKAAAWGASGSRVQVPASALTGGIYGNAS